MKKVKATIERITLAFRAKKKRTILKYTSRN
jgi:hypothetical protein